MTVTLPCLHRGRMVWWGFPARLAPRDSQAREVRKANKERRASLGTTESLARLAWRDRRVPKAPGDLLATPGEMDSMEQREHKEKQGHKGVKGSREPRYTNLVVCTDTHLCCWWLCLGIGRVIPYSSKFSRHKNFVKHSKFANLLIFVIKISWLLQSFARHGGRGLIVAVVPCITTSLCLFLGCVLLIRSTFGWFCGRLGRWAACSLQLFCHAFVGCLVSSIQNDGIRNKRGPAFEGLDFLKPAEPYLYQNLV